MLRLPPLSLYIHIPWCVRKCPYCDFNSHEAGQAIPEEAYIRALKHDLDNDLAFVQGRKLTSIFFGGGTPSLFSAQAIGDILDHAEQRIGFDSDIEITLEANPGTFEQEKFRGFHAAGVNRLSIGIQSFNNRHLQKLGRVHDRASAVTAAASARKAGFDNFNLDLMHGLPDQTAAEAISDLKLAIELNPTHLSWYQLTIEPNTVFYKQRPPLPDEDTLDDIQQGGHELLKKSGFFQYEISAYARENRRSVHNLNYWEFGDYLGIGAGAHGKITLPDKGEILRIAKTRKPEDYLNRESNYRASTGAVPADELPLEFFMNALRLCGGVPVEYFSERTGLDLSRVSQTWSTLMQQGLVESPQQRLSTTDKGFLFLNSVLETLSGEIK
ncbi:MAG: radical SAM family heme chaperone HemW [Porticoccaceae bacterium]